MSATRHKVEKDLLEEQWEEALLRQGTKHVPPLLLKLTQDKILWCIDSNINIIVTDFFNLYFETPIWWIGRSMKLSDVVIRKPIGEAEQIQSFKLSRIPNGLMFSGIFSPKLLYEFPYGTSQEVEIEYGGRDLILKYWVSWRSSQTEPALVPNPLVSPGIPFQLISPPWLESFDYKFCDLPRGYSMNEISGVIQKGTSNRNHTLIKFSKASKGSLRIQVNDPKVNREFVVAILP